MEGMLERLLQGQRDIESRLQTIEEKFDRFLKTSTQRKTASETRRTRYQKAKQRRDKGKVELPEHHIFKKRDPRWLQKLPQLVTAALQFVEADDPEGFAAYVTWQWNSATYLKKPITFSGGYYRLFLGDVRHGYGPSDLMGYNKKQRLTLRNDADHDDFGNRPWWRWGYLVLLPIWERLIETVYGERELPARFDRCMRILLGDYGEYEVYTGVYWGPSEKREHINRMLRRVGTDLRLMWCACLRGLRSQTAIPLPGLKSALTGSAPLPSGPPEPSAAPPDPAPAASRPP